MVYLNCNDTTTSEFWKFFARKFKQWGLKKLIATTYEPNEDSNAYAIELTEETGMPVQRRLKCNGDFRSDACIRLLKQADIVVTNPPFSLFREYISQLIQYKKKFIILGNLNAITYTDFFSHIINNKVWLGASLRSRGCEFRVPDSYPMNTASCRIDKKGRKYIYVKDARWWTNLDYGMPAKPLDLRKNYYYGNEDEYPTYDNYAAIEVSKTLKIPIDYDGVMAVPISFLDKYCPDQFEILGIMDRQDTYGYRTKKYTSKDSPRHNDLNARGVLVVDGKYKSMYARILIRNRPEFLESIKTSGNTPGMIIYRYRNEQTGGTHGQVRLQH